MVKGGGDGGTEGGGRLAAGLREVDLRVAVVTAAGLRVEVVTAAGLRVEVVVTRAAEVATVEDDEGSRVGGSVRVKVAVTVEPKGVVVTAAGLREVELRVAVVTAAGLAVEVVTAAGLRVEVVVTRSGGGGNCGR